MACILGESPRGGGALKSLLLLFLLLSLSENDSSASGPKSLPEAACVAGAWL
jgi:hypothetical protein